MWKFIKIALKVVIVWKFTIWFFEWLGIPILTWTITILQTIGNILNKFGKWLISGTDGAIAADVLLSISIIIATGVFLCIKYSKPKSYNSYNSYNKYY